MANFEIYQDLQNNFRWRFQANNGNILAHSEESFINKINCEHAILLMKQQSPKASISVKMQAQDQQNKAVLVNYDLM